MKRLTALLLAALLLGSLILPASAAEAAYKNPNGCSAKQRCSYSPTIIVPGIAQSNTVLYVDGEKTALESGTVMPDLDALNIGNVGPLVSSLLGSVALQRDMGLSSSAYNLMADLFWAQTVNDEGEHLYDLRTEIIGRVSEMSEDERHMALNMYVPAHSVLEIVGDDHMYFFAFNLVGEVWNNVDALEDYIDFVRKETGHDKVNLVNVSLGGTLFTGYLERYGHKKLDQVINIVSTTNGTPMMADLMTFNLTQDPAFWYDSFFPTVLATDVKIAPGYDATLGYGLGFLFRALPHGTASAMIRAIWQSLLDTIILNCTQFWAMVPRERYKETADQLLSGENHKVLRAKTDSYNQAQKNLSKNVKAAVAAGVHINNIAGAGLLFGDGEYTFFQPVASRATTNSDGIISAAGATMGATCALPGQALPPGYTPKKAGYLSPDGSIDCSTCVLPDNTWVFMNQPHEVGRNDAVLNLVAAFYKHPGMTVKTNPAKYPQFNHEMNTRELRRWRIAEAKTLLAEGTLDADTAAAFTAAIKEGEAVRRLTVGDAPRAKAATAALNALLREHGELAPETEVTTAQKWIENGAAIYSRLALKFYGDHGFSQGGSLRNLWNYVTN